MRLRANQRERALARLSRLTTASAAAATFATVGFGGLAAVTYSGTSATPSDQTALDDPSAQADASAPQANGTTTDPRATTGPTSTNRPIVVAQPPTRTRTRSHVVTGGSGR